MHPAAGARGPLDVGLVAARERRCCQGGAVLVVGIGYHALEAGGALLEAAEPDVLEGQENDRIALEVLPVRLAGAPNPEPGEELAPVLVAATEEVGGADREPRAHTASRA